MLRVDSATQMTINEEGQNIVRVSSLPVQQVIRMAWFEVISH